MIDDIVKSIKGNEGFVNHVYKDSKGIDTIGYGTKMPLSKVECSMLLEHRLKQNVKHLQDEKPFIAEFPDNVQSVLYEMSYQMGVDGLLKFKNTWKYLKEWDFVSASVEMLDSKWAKIDSPSRAKKLSEIMKRAQKHE